MTMQAHPELDFDHSDPTLVADPYPVYKQLREQCPVARGHKFGGFWIYSRYDDVLAAELDPTTYASSYGVTTPFSFGAGIHRCLGASLGQLERRVVIEEVLKAIPGYRVDPRAIKVEGMIARVFRSLPAHWAVCAETPITEEKS